MESTPRRKPASSKTTSLKSGTKQNGQRDIRIFLFKSNRPAKVDQSDITMGSILSSPIKTEYTTASSGNSTLESSYMTESEDQQDVSDDRAGKSQSPNRPSSGSVEEPNNAEDEQKLVDIQMSEEAGTRSKPPSRRYRSSTEAPETFKEQTQILFEEDIYSLAIQDLQTNLFAQSYFSADKPWWVAPTAHIAFLGTLAIHPLYTTRAKEDGKNKKAVSIGAHRYLLDVLRSVGPINGHFKEAFAFRDGVSRTDKRRQHSPDMSEVDGYLETPLANDESLWKRVPDFWAMLGWAFSCAVLHPERWVYWKLWLELLVEVLERDLKERITLDRDRGDKLHFALKKSIVLSYIGEHRLETTILRALFAYTDTSSPLYQEIWPTEFKGDKKTKEVKKTDNSAATNKRKLGVMVDLENDEWAEWDGSEDESTGEENEAVEGTNTTVATKRRSTRRTGGRKPQKQRVLSVESPLVLETITLRLRIFAVMSELCYQLPEGEVPFSLVKLHDEFANHIRGLPLDMFRHFVRWDIPLLPSVYDQIYMQLMRSLLPYLLPPNVPHPKYIDKETDTKGWVSAVMLERCFLPFSTNAVAVDNAKLAVVLWELLSFLWRHETSDVNHDTVERMREAIMEGIKTRELKSKIKIKDEVEMLEDGWVEKTMGPIEKDPHAPANVLRHTHAKFKLLLKKMADFDLEDTLDADQLGWK